MQEKTDGDAAKNRPSILCNLSLQQVRLLDAELAGDHRADLFAADHIMYFAEGYPLDGIRLALLQHDFLQGDLPAKAVIIVKSDLVPAGAQQLKFCGIGPDAGFFKQFPGDGLQAGFAGLGSAAGIFPGAGEGLFRCAAGQQDLALAVVDPNADHQTVFTLAPPVAPAVKPAGQTTLLVINVIKFHAPSSVW